MVKYDGGFAFITEGDTEKEFYHAFLIFLCNKHAGQLTRVINDKTLDVEYRIGIKEKQFLVKFYTVNCISQMTRSGAWFNTQCYEQQRKIPWIVFLCYDKDSYLEDISKFYEGDWEELRKQLKKAQVIDVAASADIEDVMLKDLAGVCQFLHCDIPKVLVGRKGKVKMKNLFRDNGLAYHEGKRARRLIDALNMQTIIDSCVLPLNEIEGLLFGADEMS